MLNYCFLILYSKESLLPWKTLLMQVCYCLVTKKTKTKNVKKTKTMAKQQGQTLRKLKIKQV